MYFREEKEYYKYYTVKKGDSLYKIAKNYNVNPELIANINGLDIGDYIYPNEELLIPNTDYSYYITKEGDTLKGVANIFETTQNNIIKENNTIYLMAGQLIVNKKN